MCQCARRKAILLRRRGCHSEQRSFGFIRSHREIKVALLPVSRVIFRETQIHPRLVGVARQLHANIVHGDCKKMLWEERPQTVFVPLRWEMHPPHSVSAVSFPMVPMTTEEASCRCYHCLQVSAELLSMLHRAMLVNQHRALLVCRHHHFPFHVHQVHLFCDAVLACREVWNVLGWSCK